MKKKHNTRKAKQKKEKAHQKNYICPLCHKPKKAITLHDGYTICAYCGLVVYKIPYAFEKIDAPGFIVPDRSPEKNKKRNIKESMKKHYNISMMKQFIKKHK